MSELTETDRKCLAVWDRWPPGQVLTCTMIGDSLFPNGHRLRQCYARPAGKVAARLMRMGYLTRASLGPEYPDGYARIKPCPR